MPPVQIAIVSAAAVHNWIPLWLTGGCRREIGRPSAYASTAAVSLRRTELALAGPAISGRGEDYIISYRVNDGQPVQVAATVPASGAGVAFKGDAVTLVQSLPSEGEFAVHLAPRVGAVQDCIFSLVGLETVRATIAATCKWPRTVAKPNN